MLIENLREKNIQFIFRQNKRTISRRRHQVESAKPLCTLAELTDIEKIGHRELVLAPGRDRRLAKAKHRIVELGQASHGVESPPRSDHDHEGKRIECGDDASHARC
jgi:hypothetical protein